MAHSAPPAAIAAQHLGKTYRSGGRTITALRDCTLAIAPGELFGLFGPNGAGKSSLIRLLSTITLPTAGAAQVCGFDIVRQSLQVRRCLAVVSGDERTFHGRLSAQQNLEFYATLYDLPLRHARARIAATLALFGLADAASRPVQTYSTGMRQRLSLVRALLHDPAVLLLDEPTKSMDVQTADMVRRLVKEELVGRQGKTVLYTTHELYEMDRFCDRVAILNQGQLAALGTVAELEQTLRAQEHYQIELLEALSPAALADLRALPGAVELNVWAQSNGRVTLDLEGAVEARLNVEEIWRILRREGGQVLRFELLQRDAIGRLLRHYTTPPEERP